MSWKCDETSFLLIWNDNLQSLSNSKQTHSENCYFKQSYIAHFFYTFKPGYDATLLMQSQIWLKKKKCKSLSF